MAIYAMVECTVLTDVRFRKVGPAGVTMWLMALLHCKAHLSDGFVPDEALQLCSGGARNVHATAHKLVEAGLWERFEGGYGQSPETWAKHQTTRADVEADREAARVRKANERKRKRELEARRVTEESQRDNPQASGQSGPNVTRDPRAPAQSQRPEPRVQTISSNAEAKARKNFDLIWVHLCEELKAEPGVAESVVGWLAMIEEKYAETLCPLQAKAKAAEMNLIPPAAFADRATAATANGWKAIKLSPRPELNGRKVAPGDGAPVVFASEAAAIEARARGL